MFLHYLNMLMQNSMYSLKNRLCQQALITWRPNQAWSGLWVGLFVDSGRSFDDPFFSLVSLKFVTDFVSQNKITKGIPWIDFEMLLLSVMESNQNGWCLRERRIFYGISKFIERESGHASNRDWNFNWKVHNSDVICGVCPGNKYDIHGNFWFRQARNCL